MQLGARIGRHAGPEVNVQFLAQQLIVVGSQAEILL